MRFQTAPTLLLPINRQRDSKHTPSHFPSPLHHRNQNKINMNINTLALSSAASRPVVSPLLPLAPSMAALLTALKDQPFTDRQPPRLDVRSTAERSESLSALMQILHDQADQDGFRLITINAEPKRVIMACNRQGKPPPSKQTTAGEEATSVEEVSSSPSSEDGRRSNRLGTSVRCGCRMRVNINFHTKLNAWRITSFESQHNHEYGSSTNITSTAGAVGGESFQLSPDRIEAAIRRFSSAQQRIPTTPTSEREAIAVLASMHSPHLSFGSPATQTPNGWRHSPWQRRRSSSSLQGSPALQPASFPQTMENSPSVKAAEKPAPILVIRRRPSSPSLQPSSARRPSLTALTPMQPGLASSDERTPMQTAMEIDRYAMLHHSFKRLIATACRRREWTQEVLQGVGRFLESLQSQPNQQAIAVPFGPASTSSPKPVVEGSGESLPVVVSAAEPQQELNQEKNEESKELEVIEELKEDLKEEALQQQQQQQQQGKRRMVEESHEEHVMINQPLMEQVKRQRLESL